MITFDVDDAEITHSLGIIARRSCNGCIVRDVHSELRLEHIEGPPLDLLSYDWPLLIPTPRIILAEAERRGLVPASAPDLWSKGFAIGSGAFRPDMVYLLVDRVELSAEVMADQAMGGTIQHLLVAGAAQLLLVGSSWHLTATARRGNGGERVAA